MHHEHPVGQAENLFHFTRCKQNGNALACQLIDKFVDFLFGPDIDPARWLVEQQHFGLQGKAISQARPFAGCRRTSNAPTCASVDALIRISSIIDFAT